MFSVRKQQLLTKLSPFTEFVKQAQCIHSSIISVATLHILSRLVLELVTVPLDLHVHPKSETSFYKNIDVTIPSSLKSPLIHCRIIHVFLTV